MTSTRFTLPQTDGPAHPTPESEQPSVHAEPTSPAAAENPASVAGENNSTNPPVVLPALAVARDYGQVHVEAAVTPEMRSAAPPSDVPQVISVAPVQLVSAETIAASNALVAATQRDNQALRTQTADLREQVAGKEARIRSLETELAQMQRRYEIQLEMTREISKVTSRMRDRRARAQKRHRQVRHDLHAAMLDGAPSSIEVETANPKV